MTADAFWKHVGETLLLLRTRRGWDQVDIERQGGGPNHKTVKAIESGNIGTIDKLTAHADALGVSIVDVIRSVLSPQPLSPEAQYVIRAYEDAGLKGRQALLAMAQAILHDEEAPEAPPE